MNREGTIRISVRALVELLRSGDIAAGFSAGAKTADGIRCHQLVQRSSAAKCPPDVTYLAEVPVHHVVKRDAVTIEIGGRIDGVIIAPGGVTIEEIKTVAIALTEISDDGDDPLHWAQAKCYARLYAMENGLETVDVQLTYVQVDTRQTKSLRRTFGAGELREFFDGLIDRYLQWARLQRDWAALRDGSIRGLEFPFPSYRAGQQELCEAVTRTIEDGGRAFVQAPTGIGKTLATMFPAVQSLERGESAKIFYLTAKTSTRAIAENAVELMRRGGLRLKTLTITAKEKICFRREAECDPEECEFARGYYDRRLDGMNDIFALDSFTRKAIEEYALRHRLCPFEFSLDLSLLADCIICDYNYVFDPRVYLRRFFEEAENDDYGSYTFLIDEAHNLVDRAREMFSASLAKKEVLALRRRIAKAAGGKKKLSPALRRLYDAFSDLNEFFNEVHTTCDEAVYEGRGNGFYVDKESPEDSYPLVRGVAAIAEELLKREDQYSFRDELLEFYFRTRSYLRTADYFDEHYVTCCEQPDGDVLVKLFCIDPAHMLDDALKRGRAAVFFSATLSPLEYFSAILGGGEDADRLNLPSPFPRENLCLLLDDSISTLYRMRQFTYDHIARSIGAVAGARRGNYLVYFPSYQYLREVHARFAALYPGVRTAVQRSDMSDSERELFLAGFSDTAEETLVGFAVMGGVFGEGIDLTGERLSGVVIVGVGLPQIGLERDIIRDHFNEQNNLGFEYAYVYPGMNKVLQAVGRLIRTDTDRGVVLLIDQRFSTPLYRGLYPPHWHPVTRVRGAQQTEKAIRDFWHGMDRTPR